MVDPYTQHSKIWNSKKLRWLHLEM